MYKFALFARLEAKPGKENEVAKLLEAGLAMAKQEPTTPLWFALRLGPTTFGVFDAFANEDERQTHLNGPIAKALIAKAPELFAKAPSIEPLEVLGVKQAAQHGQHVSKFLTRTARPSQHVRAAGRLFKVIAMYDMANLKKFKKLGELAPAAFKSFVAFDEAALKGGAIPLKYKELMAVAVALTTQCPYCIELHAKKAKQAGATDEELAETTLVAAALRAGGAVTHGTHTLE